MLFWDLSILIRNLMYFLDIYARISVEFRNDESLKGYKVSTLDCKEIKSSVTFKLFSLWAVKNKVFFSSAQIIVEHMSSLPLYSFIL